LDTAADYGRLGYTPGLAQQRLNHYRLTDATPDAAAAAATDDDDGSDAPLTLPQPSRHNTVHCIQSVILYVCFVTTLTTLFLFSDC